MVLNGKEVAMLYKIKLQISNTDVTELYETIVRSINDINDKLQTDKKEISIYRLESMMKLHKRLQSKIFTSGISTKKRSDFSLTQTEALTIRYCLMFRRSTPGMGDLFCRIDSRFNNSIFERKEAI
jgi:hypothetical protein